MRVNYARKSERANHDATLFGDCSLYTQTNDADNIVMSKNVNNRQI